MHFQVLPIVFLFQAIRDLTKLQNKMRSQVSYLLSNYIGPM